MVWFAAEDGMVVVGLEDVDTGDEECRRSEAHGQSNGDVADEEKPSANPTCHPSPANGCEHKGLVVDTWMID